METDGAFLGLMIGVPVGILSFVGMCALICRLNRDQAQQNNNTDSIPTRNYSQQQAYSRVITQDIDVTRV